MNRKRFVPVLTALCTVTALMALPAPNTFAFASGVVIPGKGPAKHVYRAAPPSGTLDLNPRPLAPSISAAAASAAPTTPPPAVRWSDGSLHVYRSGSWQAYGGIVIANPTSVVVPPDVPGNSAETLYIGTGSDKALWVRSDAVGWRRLAPFYTYSLYGPSAVVTGAPGAYQLTVAYTGGDNALWVDTAPVHAAGLPKLQTNVSLGGIARGAPAAVAEGSAPTFYVTGTDTVIWERRLTGAWHAQVGLQCFGHPAAGVAADGSVEVMSCWAFDNSLWFERKTSGAWSGPANAGGVLSEDLAVRQLANGVEADVSDGSNQVAETFINATGLSPWSSLGGSVAPSSQSNYTMSWVPLYAQQYPLDCETAAMQMSLAGLGHSYSQSSLLALENPDYRAAYTDASGNLRWGNPYTNFVGDPSGSEGNYSGYGIYYPPILAIAQSHGSPGATGGERNSALAVYQALGAGHPVQVWVEFKWVRPALGYWLTFDGSRWIHYSTWEHSVTLVGIGANAVLVNDPGQNEPYGSQYWVSRSQFETSWGDFNNMAVVYR